MIIVLPILMFVSLGIAITLNIFQNPNGSIVENLLIGIFSSSFVVFLIELIGLLRDKSRYSYFQGQYIRKKIYTKVPGVIGKRSDIDCNTTYQDETSRFEAENVCNVIKIIKQHGENFTGTAFYIEGTQEIQIFLDPLNPSHGHGTYQYSSKFDKYMKNMPDFGELHVFRDMINTKDIFVYYKNITPSGFIEGYEVWSKNK